MENILPYLSVVETAEQSDYQYKLLIRNITHNTAVWRFSTELLRPVSFNFYQVSADTKDLVFSSTYPYSPQKTRASQGRVISSSPVLIGSGQSITFEAYFDRAPDEELFPISFAPEQVFDSHKTGSAYWHGWYLGAVIVLMLFFIVFSVVLSSHSARFYALYFLALTMLTFHSYGYSDPLFFGRGPIVYFPLFRVLQIAVLLCYLLFAISFVRAKELYRKLYLTTLLYLVLIVILASVELLHYQPYFVVIVDTMAAGFILIGTYTAYIALRDKLSGASLFALGFAVLLINGAINYFASFRAFAAYNDTVDALTLSLQSIDALIFAAAIAIQTYALRRDRDNALLAKLVATEEKLAVSEQLRSAQVERDRAKTLAENHRSQLAATSHDLRQPLMSLKLALQDSENVEPDLQEKMTTGLNYLNAILGDTLDDTRPATAATGNFGEDDYSNEAEDVPLQLIFDNLHRMFASEAEAKGLTLKFAQTSLVAEASTIVLIRILSNLAGNAIKFTAAGKVLIGARRRDGEITLQVYDTGQGIAAENLERITQPYQRATQHAEGYGLGLDIVRELTAQHGMNLHIESQPGRGSVFSVSGLRRKFHHSLKTN